ncbi:MAG: 2-hydroxyacyl-CoA dehydratase [Solobacterium sp.]|nr:2-hydroxyacyl-CoA dehydratase [Solobacterium sp.]
MSIETAKFTADMIQTHTILIPNMAPVQFAVLKAALRSEGVHVEMMDNTGSEVAQLGLRYVHNDTCYPALLIIGQYIDALNSGKYDLEHTALLITQTGGGCRASNYIMLLRKALANSGYGNIPVVSFNTSGLEKDSAFPLSYTLLEKMAAALFYGDEVFALRNQVKPYEVTPGETDRLCERWYTTFDAWFHDHNFYNPMKLKKHFRAIAESFAAIPVHKTEKVKVGVVGEIYVKYSPLGNNDLIAFLESQDCEVNLPGVMGFVEYCIANYSLDVSFYGGKKLIRVGADSLLRLLSRIGEAQSSVLRSYGFYAPGPFRELMKKPDGIIHLGAKMGEGWLLTAEMVELIEDGYANIVCAQPFGCLPNHIAGKGVINKIRERYPNANITPVDYDPSASRVNQENRIKLMLAVGREHLNSTNS